MKKQKNQFFLMLLFFLLIFLSFRLFSDLKKTIPPENHPSQLAKTQKWEKATLIKVIDGDTLLVKIDRKKEKVRLIGIDCPEKGEPYFEKARDLARRLTEGQEIRLYRDVSERDRYGRLLRYVYTDHTFLNAELVARGYARAVAYSPDLKYFFFFLQLEKEAQKQKRGIYGKLIEP